MTDNMYCMQCGVKLEPNARFCTNCGQTITSQTHNSSESAPIKPTMATTGSVPSHASPYREETTSEALMRYKQNDNRSGSSVAGAVVLSLLWPGMGQIYTGATGLGRGFLVITVLLLGVSAVSTGGLMLFLLWMIICTADAYQRAQPQ